MKKILKKIQALFQWKRSGYRIALRRIEETKRNDGNSLDLSNLNLSSEDLKNLLEANNSVTALKKISSINLSNNNISEYPEVLKELNNLQTLNLSNNGFIKIPSDVKYSRQLTISIDPKIIKAREDLQSVIGVRKALERIEKVKRNGGNSLNLNNLNLSSEDLEYLLGVIVNELPNLEELCLSRNKLTGIPSDISKLLELKNLDLGHNKIINVPESFGSLSHLQNLKLTANDIASLPDNFGMLGSLKTLNLSENRIVDLPDSFGLLNNLWSLDLSKNRLGSVPESFGNLNNLKELQLNGNQITYLPDSFGNLNELRILKLSMNRLESMPISSGNMEKLSNLDVSNNQMINLPDSFCKLVNLGTVNLSNNHIVSLPDKFGDIKNLRYLYLDSNRIVNLPVSLGNLEHLEFLSLQNNQIVSVPETLGKFRLRMGFSYLGLKNNPLSLETMDWLNSTFDVHVEYDMAAHEIIDTYTYQIIIKDLYDNEESIKIFNNISALTEVKYNILESNNHSKPVSGAYIIQDFLNKVSTHNSEALKEVYNTVIKYYLDEVGSGDATRIDTALGMLSTTLGNCATPVHDHIMNKAFGLYVESPGIFKDLQCFDKIIERAALQAELQRKLPDLNANEGVEKLQGLLNSIYLERAETIKANTIKISGERERLPSISAYPEFAFKQINKKWIDTFVQMCCQTDESNKPLKDKKGFYILNQTKLDDIKNNYLYKIQGDYRVEAFKTQWNELLKSSGLGDIIPFLSSKNQDKLNMVKDDRLINKINNVEGNKDLEKEMTEFFNETINSVTKTSNYKKAIKGLEEEENRIKSHSFASSMSQSINEQQSKKSIGNGSNRAIVGTAVVTSKQIECTTETQRPTATMNNTIYQRNFNNQQNPSRTPRP